MARGRLRLGCWASLIFCFLVTLLVYAIVAPWSFHIGGRFTPSLSWTGVGRLVDSAGIPYGLYATFYPDSRNLSGRSNMVRHKYLAHNNLRGKAQVCTTDGTKYPFNLSGDIEGAWLDTDGSDMVLDFGEPGRAALKRHFSLYGTWHGPELGLDDHKSMFMWLLPDGKLTPARSYTSPVPEKHAKVTLRWGQESDFEDLCRSLRK